MTRCSVFLKSLSIVLVPAVLSACGGTTIYVHQANGDDSLLGTKDAPFMTIQAAIDYAKENHSAADIHIAEGVYSANSYAEGKAVVTLADNISIYGGYSNDDWAERDTTQYKTVIRDVSTEGGTFEQTNHVIYAEDVTEGTIVDGLYIYGGNGDVNLTILNRNSSPTIQNNYLYGGDINNTSVVYNIHSSPIVTDNTIVGQSGNMSYAIYNRDASHPSIMRNKIIGSVYTGPSDGEDQDDDTYSVASTGIYNTEKSNPIIANNYIDGGNITYSLGIYSEDSSPIIRNNTINGGNNASYYTMAIAINADAHPIIENNIIFNHDGIYTYGYYAFDGLSSSVLQNNNFYNMSETHGNNYSFDLTFTDLKGADGNILTIEDNDWSLYSYASPELVSNGINGNHPDASWSFDDDISGTLRAPASADNALGWTIGAHEHPGTLANRTHVASVNDQRLSITLEAPTSDVPEKLEIQ